MNGPIPVLVGFQSIKGQMDWKWNDPFVSCQFGQIAICPIGRLVIFKRDHIVGKWQHVFGTVLSILYCSCLFYLLLVPWLCLVSGVVAICCMR